LLIIIRCVFVVSAPRLVLGAIYKYLNEPLQVSAWAQIHRYCLKIYPKMCDDLKTKVMMSYDYLMTYLSINLKTVSEFELSCLKTYTR